MEERPERIEGEFGNEGNPPDVRAPRTPAAGEFGGEGNREGFRPEDADPNRPVRRDDQDQPVADD